MAIRPSSDKDAAKIANERLDRFLGRAYLLWLFGIAVGLVKLKADKVTFSGIEYTIENPEVIQGLIFVGSLFCFVAILGVLIIFSLQWSNIGGRSIARRMIYLAARPRLTLRNKTTRQIWVIKRVARILYKLAAGIFAFIALLPVLHILLFEHTPLWLALKAMFS